MKKLRRFWKDTAKPGLIILLIVTSLRSAVADWNDVPTGSMKPTILEGDRVFINKLAYDLKVPFTTWHVASWSNPSRGDIVVFFSPKDGTRLVKRVVGLPGDTVSMDRNRLFVNGEPVAYEPLESTISEQVGESERLSSEFAAEKLANQRHAVMATPGLNAIRSFAPVTVGAGSYFMMGDNRDNSFDSRYFGSVARERILGQATAVAFSLDYNRHHLPRANRFFEKLE